MGWISRNWFYRVVALFAAVVVWAYVHQEDAIQPRTFDDTVEIRNRPEGTVTLADRTEVSVTVTGPTNRLDSITEGDVTLWVDLRNAQKAGIYRESIRHSIRGNDGFLRLTTTPDQLTIRVEPTVSVSLPVKGILSGAEPLGRTHARPRVTPPSARVTGRGKDVIRVRQLVASVLANGNDINHMARILPLDARGDPVPEVRVEPDEARIVAPLRLEPLSREILVNPSVFGNPASGYRHIAFRVRPPVVTARGEASVVSRITAARTSVIDIDGLDATRTVAVGIKPISGVEFEPETVSVTVEVEPIPKRPDPAESIGSRSRPPRRSFPRDDRPSASARTDSSVPQETAPPENPAKENR